MNLSTLVTALTILEMAANTTVALQRFKVIVEAARLEGRDISDAELRALAAENEVKLEGVLALLRTE